MCTKFEECSIIIHWDMLRTNFLCDLTNIWPYKWTKGQIKGQKAQVYNMGHMCIKFEECSIIIHWDMLRTNIEDAARRRPPAADNNNNPHDFRLWVNNNKV